MGEQYSMEQEEIFSKVMRAGRRTYFFDVRATKAGDYYLTVVLFTTKNTKSTYTKKTFMSLKTTLKR
jgi:hypothetical protein